MSDAALVLPADVAQPTGFLRTLLTMSLTGAAVLRPLYAEDGETIHDFAWVSLNPAGPQLLGQPACPPGSLLALLPVARVNEGFANYCRAFTTGELIRHEANYQAGGVTGYFLTVAQCYENVLVINFTAAGEQPRSAAKKALGASKSRKQVTLATTERERLQALFAQAPVAIGLFEGEEVRITAVNAGMTDILGYSAEHLLDRPLLEAMSEITGQGFDYLLRQVPHTQQAVVGQAMPATIKQRRRHHRGGQPGRRGHHLYPHFPRLSASA